MIFLIFLGGGVYSKYEKIWRVAKTLRSKWVNNLLIFMEGIVFLTFTIHSRQKSRWWQPKYFLFSSLPGEMIQFDDHIFQRGWFNHQQENPSTVAPGQRPSWATQVAQCCCVLCRRLCLLVRVFVTHRLRKSFWGPHHEGNTYEISDVWSHVPQQKASKAKDLGEIHCFLGEVHSYLGENTAKWALIKEFLVGCFKSGDEKPPSYMGELQWPQRKAIVKIPRKPT